MKVNWDRIPISSRRAIEEEHEREFFSDLAAKLAAGARGNSVSLSPNEYAALLEVLRNRREPVDGSEVAEYSRYLEFTGEKTKAAVSKTVEKFGVSRSAVFSARKKYLKD
jgi:hypothetical protein